MVKSWITCQRRRQIDLEQPRIELIIDHNIEAEKLEAVASVRHMHLEGIVEDGFWRYDCLDYDVLNSAKEALIVHQVLSKDLS